MTNNEEPMWYLSLDGTQQGPYAAADIVSWLQDGRITPQTPCWREGMGDWLAIEQAPDFHSLPLRAEGLPKLSSKAKRRLRLVALSIPAIALVCGGAVVLYYALGLNIPATIRGAMRMYDDGDYVEAYQVLQDYIERSRPLIRDIEDLKQRQSLEAFRSRAKKLLHPEAAFLMGKLMALHSLEIATSMIAKGRKLIDMDLDPEMMFALAIEIDPSYERKVQGFLSEALSQRLNMGFEETVQELTRYAKTVVEARRYDMAKAMLDAFSSESSYAQQGSPDLTGKLIQLMQKYDRDASGRYQRQYDEYRKTAFPAEARKQAAKKTVEQLLPELAASLENYPAGELKELIETGYRNQVAKNLSAVVSFLADVRAGHKADPAADQVFLALLAVCEKCLTAGPNHQGLFPSREWDPVVELAALGPERFLPPMLKLVAYSSDLSLSLVAHTQAALPSSGDIRPFNEADSRAIYGAVTQQLVRVCLAHAAATPTSPLRNFSRDMWPATEVDKVFDPVNRYASDMFQQEDAYFAAAWINAQLKRSGSQDLAGYRQNFPSGQYMAYADKAGLPPVPEEPPVPPTPPVDQAQARIAEEQKKEEERLRKLEAEVRALCEEPPLDGSTYEMGKARRDCRKALQLLENETALAELQAQAKALMSRIELAEDPAKRFVFKGHMVSGKGVLLRIYDGLDGQTHSIPLGDSLYGFKFQTLSSDNKELEVTRRGDTFTLRHE